MNQTVQTTSPPRQLPTFQRAWDFVIGEVRTETSRGEFDTWIKSARPLGYQGHTFTLGVHNSYARDWLESHFKSRFTQLLEGVYNERVTLNFALIDEFGAARTSSKQARPAIMVDPGPDLEEKEPLEEETQAAPAAPAGDSSSRKVMLHRAYGSARASVIEPEHSLLVTLYFFTNWVPLLGHSGMAVVLAARSMCFWNPLTGNLRNTYNTDMSELAKRASLSVRTVKDVLSTELIRRYFLRYKVRRISTPNGVRTAGIAMNVRMDDPLTPEDQAAYNLPEDEHWYLPGFEDEEDEEEEV